MINGLEEQRAIVPSSALIRARRAELVARKDAADLAYARLEAEIASSQNELRLRMRELDQLHGAIVALDNLLRELEE